MIQIMQYGQVPNEDLFQRTMTVSGVEKIVKDIIEDVRQNGDEALRRYNRKFDRADFEELEASKEEIDQAFTQVDRNLLEVMERSAKNIRAYHSKQVRNSYVMTGEDGIVLGQKIMPLARVGLYVPGGTASYPSSVLMNCIPAVLAGVPEIIMVTPATDGKIAAPILAAAKIAGVDRIFKVGGAQAVAALAYGTQSIPRVDKIVGPGNAFVAEAKKQVYGQAAVDMIAGPSEILVIADSTCRADYVAADMLSQAEHDKLATAVLITDSMELAKQVAQEIERQLALLPREEIARTSIETNGKIIVTDDLKKAVEVANEIAPEHLELSVANPFDYLDQVRNAGSIFMGKYCPESLGDYFAGTNHTLPTMGTARFSSPLSVDDFVKKSSFTYYTKTAFEKVAADVAAFAESEGLQAHARAATIRVEGEK